jgi:hypothetical protein
MYILKKGTSPNIGTYFDLKLYKNHSNKPTIFAGIYKNFLNGISDKHVFSLPKGKLKIIKSWPLIYWISDEFREKFKLRPLSEVFDICNGISSGGNNERFYRFWWEIAKSDILSPNNLNLYKWATINKGGDFNKWYGNLWLVFKWANNGEELRGLKTKYPSIRHSYDYYYFHEGLAFSGSTSKGLSVRYQPPFCLFERSGKSIFGIEEKDKKYYYLLSLLNSKIVYYISNCLNPTVSIQTGDIERIPYIIPDDNTRIILESLSEQNVLITKHILSYKLCEQDFSKSPLYSNKFFGFNESIKYYLNYENHLNTQVLINEAIINEVIYDIYDLSKIDKEMIHAIEGESIGRLPVSEEARDAYLSHDSQTIEFALEGIRNFIERLETKIFSNEERGIVEEDFSFLYQGNNSLEEFCIHHQINPINVWYWFKKSNVIPRQRMNTMAMELLADIVREILMEDNDGIIPLVSNAGEKILIERIEEKFREMGFSMAQYSSFGTLLGRQLNEFLSNNFFKELSNYLKLFKRLPATPFIWHLSSGPEQGFVCYTIIYKWSRDKLMRIRSVYVEQRERALINRQSDLNGNQSADAQQERDKIRKQLKEIQDFKLKREKHCPPAGKGIAFL